MKMVAAVSLVVTMLWPAPTRSEALAVAISTDGAVTFTLTDEPCVVKGVSNLDNRALWVQKDGKRNEGCWGAHVAYNMVMVYWDDQSVSIHPARMFKPVTRM